MSILFSDKPPTVPLFAAEGKKYATLVGSGALCLLGGKPFIITCAHVAVRFANKKLITFFSGKFFELPHTHVHRTQAAPGDVRHDNDPFDIATIPIPDNWLDIAVTSTLILDWNYLYCVAEIGDDCYFTLCGFPGSQNSKVSLQGSGRVRCRAISLKGEKGLLPLKNYAERWHIAAKWNPDVAFDNDGNQIKPPELWGMSGGPVVSVWDGKLVWLGMGIYADPEAGTIVAIRAEAILNWIEELRALGDVPINVWDTRANKS